MSHYTGALSFVLVLMCFSLVKIDARDSLFFTKALLHANDNVNHHVEPPSLSASSPSSPSPSPLSPSYPSPSPSPSSPSSSPSASSPSSPSSSPSPSPSSLYPSSPSPSPSYPSSPSPSPSPSPSYPSSPSPSPSPLSLSFPSPFQSSPSPSLSPSPAPVEAEIYGGYGLYARDVPNNIDVNGDSLFENNIPTEEFNQKFGKDEFDNNGLPSNYNEHSYVTVPQGDNKEKFDNDEFDNKGLPSNYNEGSYVTVPQGDNKDKFENKEFGNNELPTVAQGDNKDKFENEEFNNNGLPSNYNEHSYDTKFTPTATNYQNELVNNEEKLTPEEEKLFDQTGNNNERTETSFGDFNEPQKLSETPKFAEMDTYNSDTFSVKKPQGMSDTRNLEDGKYYYALDGDVKGGPAGTPKFNSEGYYGNNKAPKYEFDTREEYEKQEGYSQIPGEYSNP